jgi:hypothetical protein
LPGLTTIQFSKFGLMDEMPAVREFMQGYHALRPEQQQIVKGNAAGIGWEAMKRSNSVGARAFIGPAHSAVKTV